MFCNNSRFDPMCSIVSHSPVGLQAAVEMRRPPRLSLLLGSVRWSTSPRMMGTRLEAELLETPFPKIPTAVAAETLASWLSTKRNVVILTGAGVSTGSGIPDYRGPRGAYRKGHRPTTHDEFLTSEATRKRYWLRSLRGYDALAGASPNPVHRAVYELQERGVARLLITQNVDGLHSKAGSDSIDLHGRADTVHCMACGTRSDRKEYHNQIERELHKVGMTFSSTVRSDENLRPDGDSDVNTLDFVDDLWQLPPCSVCGHDVLKPDVVFFGDNVPKGRVDTCLDHLAQADGLLCLGSSLAVFSAYRFVLAAHQSDIPICIVNYGKTRADLLIEQGGHPPVLKLDADLDALPLALPLLFNFTT